MIEYIKGELVDATPAWVVVECNGLGYGINVSLNTLFCRNREKGG